jgi:hypothetical protein
VDCDAGGSINAALAQQAERLDIYVTGTCREDVYIFRDHVSLSGDANTKPTLMPQDDSEDRIVVTSRGRMVSLTNIRIVNSELAVVNVNGELAIGYSEIANNRAAILSLGPGYTQINHCQIHDNASGAITARGGSLVDLAATHIERNQTGIRSESSTVWLSQGTTIRENSGEGIILEYGSSGDFGQTYEISGNGSVGVQVGNGSSLFLRGGTITGNARAGITASGSSSVHLGGFSTTVADNRGFGISVENGSSLVSDCCQPQSIITGNEWSGIRLSLSSFWFGPAGVDVSGNGWRGISCETQAYGICDSSTVNGSVSGCGTGCPDRQMGAGPTPP